MDQADFPIDVKNSLVILMPVFQAQAEFDQTMSCLCDSDRDFEIIVVDDGSKPPLLVDRWRPKLSIKLIRCPNNIGITKALNIGVKQALDSGCDFIARLDAGDYPAVSRFTRQCEYLAAHPDCMLVGSDTELRDELGNHLFTIRPPRDPRRLHAAMHERVWLLHPGVTFRSSVFYKVGLYSTSFPAAEDYELFMRIAREHEIGVVPETLLTYVVRDGSISSRKKNWQALSRLLIQLKYFDVFCYHSYYGIVRTIGAFFLPTSLKMLLKINVSYG